MSESTSGQSVRQSQLCAQCRRGYHERCEKRHGLGLCCCQGEPNKQASKGSKAPDLRLTLPLPKGIAEFLYITKGDTLDWTRDYDPFRRERFVSVRKSKRQPQ